MFVYVCLDVSLSGKWVDIEPLVDGGKVSRTCLEKRSVVSKKNGEELVTFYSDLLGGVFSCQTGRHKRGVCTLHSEWVKEGETEEEELVKVG